MTTATPTPKVEPPPYGEVRLILNGVRWQTYESLIGDRGDASVPHYTYDRGTLEIVSPLLPHESREWLLEHLVTIVLEEWGQDFLCLRHLTLRRADIAQGCEPDSCFYLDNLPHVEGRDQIRMDDGDPPPDLVIEVDITSPSVDKLPLYAAFGVPEVWRCTGETVTVLVLSGDSYQEHDQSRVLPRLDAQTLTDFLRQGISGRQLEWTRQVREWARQATDG